MKLHALVFAALSLAAVVPNAASAAEKACPHAGQIVDLADLVLEGLKSPAPRYSRRLGNDAAHLKLHYGKLPDSEADAILQSLLKQKVQAAQSFVQAYYIAKLGYEAGRARLDPATRSYFDRQPLDHTLIRAFTQSGQFTAVIENFTNTLPEVRKHGVYSPATALVDLPDDEKRKLAEAADAGGVYAMAGALYASMATHEDWQNFVKRNFERPAFPWLRPTFIAYSGYHPETPALPDPRARINNKIFRIYARSVYGVSFRLPETSLPLQYGIHNRFGPVYPVAASRALQALLKAGTIKSTDNMDESWLAAYRAMIARSKDAKATMARMAQVPFKGRRHQQTNAADLLNWMLAVEAITPWLKGKVEKFPEPPHIAGERLKAEWADWQTIAAAVRSNRDLPAEALERDQAAMAAELYFAKGDYRKLVDFIASQPSPAPRLPLAVDFESRLDRLCDSRLYFPGEGIKPPSELSYDFGPTQ